MKPDNGIYNISQHTLTVKEVLDEDFDVTKYNLKDREFVISLVNMLRSSYNKFIDDVLEISAKFSAGVDEE